MDFTTPAQLVWSQPDLFVPEQEKDEEWIKQNLRYIFSHYNRPCPTWNADAFNENYTPVERGILNSLYYLGKQRNINYNHITQDTEGNVLPVTWIRIKKVKTLIDRLVGDLIKQLGAKKITAQSLSSRAKSEKMKLWEETMLQFNSRIKSKLDELEEITGMRFVPPLADKYNSQQEAIELLKSFKDELEEVAVFLGNYIEWNNDYGTTITEAFRQDFAPANLMAIYFYAENGRIKSKRVPFYNLVYDIRSDDPFLRDAQFCGLIERLTTREIFKRFPNLTETQKNEIKELEKEGDFQNNFFNFYNQNPFGNIQDWWTARRNDTTAMCFTGYWICPRDTDKKKITDKYKNQKYVKTEKNEKGEVIYDLYKATIVGNCYLVDSGYDENVVRSIANKADPEMPVKIFSGNTILGEGMSPIGLVTDLIDTMDALDFKIREMMGKHKGKGYIIDGRRLQTTSKDFIQNMATLGVDVVTTSGEDSAANNMPPVYPIDMTLDNSIAIYSGYYNEMERRVEQNLNLSPTMLGTASPQQGLGVMRTNISMSTTGNLNLYNNLFKYNEICLQYAINLAKIVYGRGEHKELSSLIVGERGLKVLEILQKYLFEDVMIRILPSDIITDEKRQRILYMLQAFAQQGNIDPLSYVRAEMADTLSQIESDFELAFRKKEEKELAQMQAQQMAQMQNIQANNEGQFQTVQTKAQADAAKEQEKNITKIMLENLKQKKQQPVPAGT